jgi:thiol-disulfide isomerase/thioredoxin
MKKIIVFIFTSCIFSSLLLVGNNVFATPYPAPEINLPGEQGEVRLTDYEGKVVYLDFWASWCIPCKKSFPWMAKIKKKYSVQGFEVIAVNLDKDKKLADEFLKMMNINFVIAFDDSGKSASDYDLQGMPVSYLIGRDSKVHASHLGFREQDKVKLEQAIQTLLKIDNN